MGRKLDNGTVADACLDRVSPGEPVFVLRAQDKTAPGVILTWLQRNLDTLPDDKLQEARRCLVQFQEWQAAHPDRVKMPD